jgi:Protein of unknown function (DUF1203)
MQSAARWRPLAGCLELSRKKRMALSVSLAQTRAQVDPIPQLTTPRRGRMRSFRCVAISAENAVRLRCATVDDFGHTIQRFNFDRTYPCRHCLREASGKCGMLLLSYQTAKPKSVYGQPTAIFMCASACKRFEWLDTIPEIVRNRLVSFRAFRGDGMMIYEANEIIEGDGHGAAVRRTFSCDDVAYINAHTAKAGCMLCHIERA